MDAKTFSAELVVALNSRPNLFRRVVLETEDLTVEGRAYLSEERFLSFYFNAQTGTTAFALIDRDNRIWGIDRKKRSWHLHPWGRPEEHREIESVTIAEVINLLAQALAAES